MANGLQNHITQQLVGLKIALHQFLQHVGAEHQPPAAELSARIDRIVLDTQRMANELLPQTLTEAGLLEAVQEMLHHMLGRKGIRYTIEYFNLQPRYPAAIERAIFRAMQGLANSVLEHASATQVSVQLFESKRTLTLLVEDNGQQHVNNPSHKNTDLQLIEAQLACLNGRLTLHSNRSSGFSALARIPLGQPNSSAANLANG